MLDTYAHLQETIAATLMRVDLETLIPDWITMCEASIRRLLKSQAEVGRAYVTGINDQDRYRTLPADFYELVAPPRVDAAGGQSLKLEYVTPRVMDDLWANPTVACPRFFTIVGAQLQFYPQPNGEQIEIAYRKGVIPLATATDGVNPLLLEAPDIYLYGSLVHSAPLLHEDERVQMWQGLYSTALADLNLAHQRKRFSGGPLVMRPRRAIG